MSDKKAFGKFPAATGGYQYIDIFRIESIGQSTSPEAAVIFLEGTDQRYYQVEIPKAELERSGEPDAASWCLSLVSQIARVGGEPLLQESDDPYSEQNDSFGL